MHPAMQQDVRDIISDYHNFKRSRCLYLIVEKIEAQRDSFILIPIEPIHSNT